MLMAFSAAAKVATDRSFAVIMIGTNDLGVHEAEHLGSDVAQVLANDAALRVADAAATKAFGHKDAPAEAGAALKVRFVFIGEVTSKDAGTEIVAKLVDVQAGKAVWAGTFFTDEDNILTVPTEIASQIATQLKGVAL